jgi:hypothetical protein
MVIVGRIKFFSRNQILPANRKAMPAEEAQSNSSCLVWTQSVFQSTTPLFV